MSDVSASEVKLFDEEVHHQYQEKGGKIRPFIYTKTGVIGGSVSMPVYGRGFAKDAATGGADVETMGTTTSNVDITLVGKQASEYSNIFDEDTVNFDDRKELAMVIAGALGRTEDQFVCDALVGATFTNTIASDFEVTGTDTGLTVEKIMEAAVLMDDAGVPEEDRYIVAPAKAGRSLLKDVKATSSDFVGDAPMENGRVKSLLGFTFIWIGDSVDAATGDKYGCDNNGTTSRSAFAFHRSSLGMGIGNLDKQSRIDYVAQKTSYLVLSPLRAGAVVRDETGCVEINIKL